MDLINVSNYNYDAIKYFISIAKHGSLSKAAKSLGLSQSALSQSMKNLEQTLGVVLFNRNTRGIILTEEGKVLFEKSLIGDKAFKNAIVETKKLATFDNVKAFKISASRASLQYCVLNNFKQIVNKFPTTNFEFKEYVHEYAVVEKLQNNEFDLAILKASKEFSPKEIECKLIKKLHYVMAYNPNFFNLSDKLTFAQLNSYPIIIKIRDGRRDSSWLQYSFVHTICCKDDFTVFSLVKKGIGVGLLPKEIAEIYGFKTVDIQGAPKVDSELVACYCSSNKTAKEIVKLLKF